MLPREILKYAPLGEEIRFMHIEAFYIREEFGLANWSFLA